jgi:hypothetical protein
VDNIIPQIKDEIRNFILKVLNENREIETRKLIFLSIRISYKQDKAKYALIIQENIDNSRLDNSGIFKIAEEFFQRLNNRDISINELKSIHFHLILN